ncbi:hypothetical protein Taro_008380 [Colocasia esculenta]|uniref:AT-hook motif nuclear-localized protein n=1 Tax=Colocasia esculenta TaxID=4460 RepID=A0A843TX19_COLES|nr:hypothetical protein [Colocasia esculenta]
MEVRSEQFGVGLQNNPMLSQPSMQNMRLAFTSDGAAIYKQVNSSSPTYQGSAGAGEAPGGGGDGAAVTPATAPHGIDMNMGEPLKRKRGRPRKYGTDGSMSLGLSSAPSYPPVAAGSTGFSSPLAGIAPNTAQSASSAAAGKKPRGRPPGSGKKKQMAALGSAGIGFTPHVITVKAGEELEIGDLKVVTHHPTVFGPLPFVW